ncbi:PREDICTED: uncharacterized protein LOC106750299 isoform X7 [Dinoponera quadriceps]|uniref:Uncharacterized protein LOC106750299 isoform X7 n=1 Tax=Dinoponera quadriceps TaxID=609295 RepID=A0A6P3Y586_DINQU|nr:PREDICTED: uncharacterized protein LOC106750299 isoform X7 [Dinoponera quadriceps]
MLHRNVAVAARSNIIYPDRSYRADRRTAPVYPVRHRLRPPLDVAWNFTCLGERKTLIIIQNLKVLKKLTSRVTKKCGNS